MDLSQPPDYARLAAMLHERQAETVVMYLATAPDLFTRVCEQVAAAGLRVLPRAEIEATPEHVGSQVVMFGA